MGEIREPKGDPISSDKGKADALNAFFATTFTDEDIEFIPRLQPKHTGESLTSISITEDDVYKKLVSLSKYKSAGSGGIHPCVLKATAASVSEPLALIYNTSLKDGKLPSAWKASHVVPVHKKGSKVDVRNYRPISLTSVPCKVLESLIRDEIVRHLLENDLLCDEQHGFVPGRSCVTQLLTVMEEWTQMIDIGTPIDVIYLDFKKAFDSVPHLRLLSKLDAYGIGGELKAWITDFLHGRYQRVKVNEELSDWTRVRSGVPQGSVLGPTMFVLSINDLPEGLKGKVKIYADDTKLYGKASTNDDLCVIQSDLDTLTEWSSTWQLHFNSQKCKVLHIGPGNAKHTYYLGADALEHTTVERDLGILIDDELKFHDHVASVVKKANGVLSCIRRSFECKDMSTIPRLYKGLVRPILDYGNSIWYPRFKGDAKAIEKVQKRATKMIYAIRNHSYTERLKALNLPSLEYRRRRGDMIQIFKIVHGFERIPSDAFFVQAAGNTRGHSLKLSKPRCLTKVRQDVFSQRVISDWNSLPDEVVRAKNVNSFKTRLDKVWADQRFCSPYE